jgi:NADPH2:quinone reductase
MRAVRLHELGGTPVVEEVDPPDVAEPLRVSSAALNPVDISTGAGRFYGGRPELPYTVGSEAIAFGAEGERLWLRGAGMMAELAAKPQWAFAVPDALSDAQALACGIAGLTGWLAVSWRAPVRADDTVLVLGASGIVGGAAVQAAKLLGAREVIGAARRTELIPAVADARIDLARDEELPAATLIVDSLWGEPLERALAAAAPGARIVHLGQSAGPAATLLSAWVRGKSLVLLGHALGAVPEEVAREAFAALCDETIAGRLSLETRSYPLERAPEAWERQASGSSGAKIVVEFT